MPPPPLPVIWRSGAQLAQAIRAARGRMGLTQAQLARRARVGMKFMYELEAGKDTLRADKVLEVLDALGLRLLVMPRGALPRPPEAREERARYAVDPHPRPRDWIGMACISSGVSLRTRLGPDELIRALLTGVATEGKEAHFIVLLEEASAELLRGLAAQAGVWASPQAVEKNLRRIAKKFGIRRRVLA